MAFDAFMYITGGAYPVQGETLDTDFKKQQAFEIKSFKIEVKNPTSMGSAGGGAGTGKCQLEPFEVAKVTDNCSPSLFKCCATGAHYPTAVISVRKAGGAAASGTGSKTGIVYLTYTFNCVFVNSVSWSGSSGDDLPEETVQFAYGSVTIQYTPQTAGGGGAPKKNIQTWNQVTNNDNATVPDPS
jgi:type VI secretion system secreted protein Hcp